MINIQQIRDTIFQIFSEDGYVKNNVTVKFPELLNVSITKNDTDININFREFLPYISWKKLITLSAYINGFTLGETGGTVKLKYLPDITFSYEKTQELMSSMFEKNYGSIDFSDIQDEINKKFEDDARKKLASRCLQYGTEWATIASKSCDFNCANVFQKKKMKQDCYNFIAENIKNEEKYGSVVLSFILIYVLLPVILKFIVERIFRKLFS